MGCGPKGTAGFPFNSRENRVANHLRHSEAAGPVTSSRECFHTALSHPRQPFDCSFISHLSTLYTHFSGTLINCQRFQRLLPCWWFKKQNWQQPWNDIQPGYHICCLSRICTLGRRLEVKNSYKTSLRSKHLHIYIYNKRRFVVPDDIFHSWTYWVSKLDRANAKQF